MYVLNLLLNNPEIYNLLTPLTNKRHCTAIESSISKNFINNRIKTRSSNPPIIVVH